MLLLEPEQRTQRDCPPFSEASLLSMTARSLRRACGGHMTVSRAREKHVENTNPLRDETEEVKKILEVCFPSLLLLFLQTQAQSL